MVRFSIVQSLALVALLSSVAGHGPAPSPPYEVLGSIDVATGESSIFLFRGAMYLLENIFCGYIDHAGQWDPRFAGKSYARVRELETGAIVANVTETAGTSFVSAFVDGDTVWLSALNEDRCKKQCGTGVLAIKSTDLTTWTSKLALPDASTCNTEVARVAAVGRSAALPPHRYVMILEPFTFMLNNNADGDLTGGWFPAPNATAPPGPSGGPSIRHSGDFYYVITGGQTVYLFRSRDLRTWEAQKAASPVFIRPTAPDATVAPLAGFPAQASRKGFDTMAGHPELWDQNSNDADVCCYNDGDDAGSWVIWGASTQGGRPTPPAKHGSTNVVARSNLSLPLLLESFF